MTSKMIITRPTEDSGKVEPTPLMASVILAKDGKRDLTEVKKILEISSNSDLS